MPQVPPETQLSALGLHSLSAVPSQATSPFLHLFILEVGLLEGSYPVSCGSGQTCQV